MLIEEGGIYTLRPVADGGEYLAVLRGRGAWRSRIGILGPMSANS